MKQGLFVHFDWLTCAHFTKQEQLDQATEPWGVTVERIDMWVDAITNL